MATGYEQVRSVVAGIAGDHVAAREVRLALPETGVCSAAPAVEAAQAGCCGGPAPAETGACCVRDAEAKAEGASGCGCGDEGRRRRNRRGRRHGLLPDRRMTAAAADRQEEAGRARDR